VLRNRPALPRRQRRVLQLLQKLGSDQACYMTQKEIAERAGVSARTVWTAIRRAEARGELAVYGHYAGRRAVITGYRLHTPGNGAPRARGNVTEPPPPVPSKPLEANGPLIGDWLRRLL
jgi:DNA-binding Lrp family transcriptional regulator